MLRGTQPTGRRRWRGPLLALIAALAAGATAGPAVARPGLETIVQDDGSLLYRPLPQVQAAMAKLRALGVETVRLTANWSLLTRAPGARVRPAFDARDPAGYDQSAFTDLDNAVISAGHAGLGVLMDIGFWAPVWATSDRRGPRARTNVSPADFRDFSVALARRYSGRWAIPQPAGSSPPAMAPPAGPPPPDQALLNVLFGAPADQPVSQPPPAPGPLPRVSRFSLWNEPNHPGLLLPQWVPARGSAPVPASAGIYRRMVQAAYPAVKAARPDAAVLIGNTSSIGSYRNRGPVPPLRFIRAMACVDARFRPLRTPDCRHFTPIPGDGWAHHPYAPTVRPDQRSGPATPDDVLVADLPRLAATLDRLVAMGRMAAGLRTIYSTEFGYETHATPGRAPLTQSAQARYLTWAEYVTGRAPSVRSFAQFLLRDQAPGAVRVSDSAARPFGQYYTGLEFANGAPKLAERSFVAGLFAQRAGHGGVMLWARLRLGPGTRAVRVERRLGRGPWVPASTLASPALSGPPDQQLNADGQSVVQRYARWAPRASYRLDYADEAGRWVIGLPVPVVRPLAVRR